MDIDKLEASRELDVLILDNVFGNEHKSIHHTDYYREGNDYVLIPFYSTDIAAAWKVVEKFIEDNDHRFFDGLMEHPPLYGMRSELAALTICRAALKAGRQ